MERGFPMKTKDLIAAAKARRGIPSNYRLARELDVPEKTVQRWHTGKNVPSGRYASKLAELAEMDPDYVAAALRAETVADPDEKAVWERIATRLSKLMAVAACAILSLFITGGPDGGAWAATPGAVASAAPCEQAIDESIHCRLFGFAGLRAFFCAVRAFFTGVGVSSRKLCAA